MKLSAALLTGVATATLVALILGFFPEGLTQGKSTLAMLIGIAFAVLAYLQTRSVLNPKSPALSTWDIILWVIFALAALRSFLWLIFPIGNEWRVQSPNNLGDLAMHIHFIEYLASGVRFWPESPLFYEGPFRYPFGIDLFNALQVSVGLPLFEVLKWTGLIASAVTAYALWRWGGAFTMAAFLFAGGLIGFRFFQTLEIHDYQTNVAWKNLFLALFVTQRGLLWALPAGLLLLIQFRSINQNAIIGSHGNLTENRSFRLMPFWVQLVLYASMPLFHMHTFIAISIVLFVLWIFAQSPTRSPQKEIRKGVSNSNLLSTFASRFRQGLGGQVRSPAFSFLSLPFAALIPASILLYLVTGGFSAGSFLAWNPGWMPEGNQPQFWLLNFGLALPLALAAIIKCALPTSPSERRAEDQRLKSAIFGPRSSVLGSKPFALSSLLLFLLAITFRFAPWEWDNIKLLLWSWLIIAPIIWSEVIRPLKMPLRCALCFGLFFSGAISLLGGLDASHSYSLISREELAKAHNEIKNIPPQARFAIEPTYNNPLLLLGRKVVMGYPGHIWSHGYNYQAIEAILTPARLKADPADPAWKELKADYLSLKSKVFKVQTE